MANNSDLHTVKSPAGTSYTVTVQRDQRLKKSARWVQQKDGTVLLRIPYRMPKSHLGKLLIDVAHRLDKMASDRARRAIRSDADLQARAQSINKTYFGGKISWVQIKWVGNMEKRLGSCTNGGPTDGYIRISDRMQGWPDYVVDYVIAHELAHRVHSDHSRAFWNFLTTSYPLTEKARGFIEGHGFAQGTPFAEDED